MTRIEHKPGLKFHKLDLHVHTPASHDYKDKSITPEEIIKKALNQGLNAIAITDHNTGEYIDKIKEVAKGKIIIIPGVEISVAGGKEGNLHIIGLFDPTHTTKHIENLLGALSIDPDKYGTEEAYSSKSLLSVIDEIHKKGGLPVFAHANSSHGILHDIKGNPRTELIQAKNLAAVEATDNDFNNEVKRGEHKRVCDLLDGNDPTYQVQKAVYQSSDCHTLGEIGSNYTYFKLEEITINGLRQCFCDPDVRIKQKEEYEIKHFPKITEIKVSNGFLNNQTFLFHEGLNCIIGGKGVGKSLIIEFLRFGLNQSSKDRVINNDHISKIEKRLGLFGSVIINFELENGEKYEIKRTYDGESNPLECTNQNTNDPYNGEIAKIFPVLFYSQNEINRTADDPESQLRLIDSFIDPSIFNSEIKSLRSKLSKIDEELAESIAAISETTGIQTEIDGVTERLKNIDLALKNELYVEIKTWEKNHELFEGHLEYHNELLDALKEFKKEIIEIPIQEIQGADESRKNELEKISKESKDLSSKLFDSSLEKVEKNFLSIQKKYENWLPEFHKKQTVYSDMIRDSGGDKAKLEAERRKLNKQLEKLSGDFKQHSEKMAKYSDIIKIRNQYLDTLDSTYLDYFNARKEIFDRLNSESRGKLLLKIDHNKNREKFKNELLQLKKGSKIREPDINKIANAILPRKFIDYVINDDAKTLAKNAGIAIENAKKLIDSLNSKENIVDILSLAYVAYPEDIPSIEYLKDDDQYYPISELSGGQKSIALLIIALAEGSKPIIIDQPEDSLDNPSVYDDIVSKLRIGKEYRQFILTTHNSNIGVASDSDNFIILKSSAKNGKIDCFGAIDKQTVKTEVINHLEGGDIPYELKNKKYHIT